MANDSSFRRGNRGRPGARFVGLSHNQRLLGPIGNIPPAEAEANHYAASENLDMAA